MRWLIQFVSRMPRASLVLVVLVLICIAGCSSYAGVLVIKAIAGYLGTSRFVAGLLLGLLFLRLPTFRGGKLRGKGFLPARARTPLMLALLAICLVDYGRHGAVVDAAFIGLAIGILLAIKAIRALITGSVAGFFARLQQSPRAPTGERSTQGVTSDVIDVDFQEKKD